MNEAQFKELVTVAQEVMQALVEMVQPLIEAVAETCRKFYAAIQGEYHARGAIYGDNHDGLIRWFEELCQIARLRNEAEYIEQRHQMLAEIRAMRL